MSLAVLFDRPKVGDRVRITSHPKIPMAVGVVAYISNLGSGNFLSVRLEACGQRDGWVGSGYRQGDTVRVRPHAVMKM